MCTDFRQSRLARSENPFPGQDTPSLSVKMYINCVEVNLFFSPSVAYLHLLERFTRLNHLPCRSLRFCCCCFLLLVKLCTTSLQRTRQLYTTCVPVHFINFAAWTFAV